MRVNQNFLCKDNDKTILISERDEEIRVKKGRFCNIDSTRQRSRRSPELLLFAWKCPIVKGINPE